MSLRARFVLIAIGAMLPLLGLSVLLVARANRSGEALLTTRLEEELDVAAAQLSTRWQELRSDLLLLGENEPARLALSALPPAAGDAAPAYVRKAFAALSGVGEVTVRDRAQVVRWHLSPLSLAGDDVMANSEALSTAGPSITVHIPLTDLLNDTPLGSLEALVRVGVLLPGISLTESRSGLVLAALLPDGRLLAPPGSTPAIFRASRTVVSGQEWLSRRRPSAQPPLELVAAAIVDPYVAPFRRSARTGAVALLLAAAALTLFIIAAAQRVTRELDQLVLAAEAVTEGDMSQRVVIRGRDEIGRLARAFNTMTDSLRDTLQALAQRESLAAVGEFAAELVHEVRNPLTSMRLDLQRLDEAGGDPEATRVIAERALRQIARLERVVGGALRVARGARGEHRSVVLRQVLEAAVRATEGELSHRGVQVIIGPAALDTVLPEADPAALEQLFVNLLTNAAQALPRGGITRVTAEVQGASVCVVVADDGPGMSNEEIERAQHPFFSTKRDGTGLGLAIARRIAALHGGSISLQSVPGEGTRVLVHLGLTSAA